MNFLVVHIFMLEKVRDYGGQRSLERLARPQCYIWTIELEGPWVCILTKAFVTPSLFPCHCHPSAPSLPLLPPSRLFPFQEHLLHVHITLHALFHLIITKILGSRYYNPLFYGWCRKNTLLHKIIKLLSVQQEFITVPGWLESRFFLHILDGLLLRILNRRMEKRFGISQSVDILNWRLRQFQWNDNCLY